MDNKTRSFQLILFSGNARSLAYEALTMMKEKQEIEAKEKLAKAKEELLQAQRVHAQMLRDMAVGEMESVDLLTVHAEDHVTSSDCLVAMVTEIIEIYERMER